MPYSLRVRHARNQLMVVRSLSDTASRSRHKTKKKSAGEIKSASLTAPGCVVTDADLAGVALNLLRPDFRWVAILPTEINFFFFPLHFFLTLIRRQPWGGHDTQPHTLDTSSCCIYRHNQTRSRRGSPHHHRCRAKLVRWPPSNVVHATLRN